MMDPSLEQELAHKAVKQLGIGSWEIDLNSGRPLWSKVVYDIHEVDYDVLPDLEEAINYYPEEVRPQIENYVNKAIAEGSGWDFEVPFVTAKGRHIWVRSVGNVELKPSGEPSRIYGTFEDITKRVTAELQAKSMSERISIANQHGGVGIWDWDITKNILIWDEQMYRLYGIEIGDQTEAYDMWTRALHPEDAKQAETDLNAALSKEKDFDSQFRIRWPDGSERWIKASGKVFWSENHQPIRMVGINQDITAERNLEIQLNKEKIALEHANRAKANFLSVMSHELRTPLNIVTGLTDLMIETAEVSEENHNNLKMIQKGANLLGSMIGNILDYAQTEQGILSFKESGVDLTALTSSVLNVDNETAKQKGLEFHYESQLQEDEVLLVDSSRYEQLLHHLLVNAIKFTDTGSIHVELKELRRDEGEVVLMLKVKDTGIGIPENELKSIFEPFYQVDMQKNRVSEGAGIGLSLCKSVAEHYDGTIHVESKEGIGTTFHAKLVLKRSSERQHFKGGHGDENPKRRKVMAVEDNASNIVLIKKVLKKLGQDVIVAKNGEEAIAKYNEEKPDFVFMDLSMPLMDGFEATKIIRLMDRHTPIYALSANVMDRDVERCRDMGMNGHIAKPIRIAKLRKALFDHDDLAEPPLINVL